MKPNINRQNYVSRFANFKQYISVFWHKRLQLYACTEIDDLNSRYLNKFEHILSMTGHLIWLCDSMKIRSGFTSTNSKLALVLELIEHCIYHDCGNCK